MSGDQQPQPRRLPMTDSTMLLHDYDGRQIEEFVTAWWPQIVLWAVRTAMGDADHGDGWATVQNLVMPLQGWHGHRWETLGVLVGLGLVEAEFRVPARSAPVELGLLPWKWRKPQRGLRTAARRRAQG